MPLDKNWDLFVHLGHPGRYYSIHHKPTGDLVVRLDFPATVPTDQCEALARAFAATPGLLEALKAMQFAYGPGSSATFEQQREADHATVSAIRKAT